MKTIINLISITAVLMILMQDIFSQEVSFDSVKTGKIYKILVYDQWITGEILSSDSLYVKVMHSDGSSRKYLKEQILSVYFLENVKRDAESLTSGKDLKLRIDDGIFYYRKPEETNNKSRYQVLKFDKLKYMTLKSNGDIRLINAYGEKETTDLTNVMGLKINHGTYTWSGILYGAALGAVIGGITGVIIDNSNEKPTVNYSYPSFMGNFNFNFGVPIGIAVGLLTGALLGGIIGSQIDDVEYINLAKLNDKNRKDELIKFLKNR
jgi:hypothetical protein